MSEKMPYQPSEEELKAAKDSMTDIQRMDSKYREKAAKDGERVQIDEKGSSMLIKGDEIFRGRYMIISDEKGIKGKREFEEELMSAEAALEELEQDEVGVEMAMERLKRVSDNIGILKNRILEIKAKQEKEEN